MPESATRAASARSRALLGIACDAGRGNWARRPGRLRPGLLAVLSLAGASYALLQSLVVPALPVLQHDLHTSTTGVAWVFTAYLLAASVVTPIAGRLGDMYGKKPVLVVTLAGLGAGTLLAALTHS